MGLGTGSIACLLWVRLRDVGECLDGPVKKVLLPFYPVADAISVWEKSVPLNKSGLSRYLARA